MEATSLADPEIRDLHLLGDGAQHIVDHCLGVMSTPTFHVLVADMGLMVEADHLLAPRPDHQSLAEDECRVHLDHHHRHALHHHLVGDETQGTLAGSDRSHPVKHAHSLQVVQMHLAHVHLEDDAGALRQKAEAELHHAIGIDGNNPTQSPLDLDRGRATEGEITAGEATIAADTRHILPMIEDTGGLTSSEVGQLTTIAV